MKPWRNTFLVIIVVLTILSLLLAACGPVEKSSGNSGNGKDKDQVKEKDNGPDKVKDKDKDKDQDKGGNKDKIPICHKTGSPKKPYVRISVANDAARDGHASHPGDIIPAPQAGCPAK